MLLVCRFGPHEHGTVENSKYSTTALCPSSATDTTRPATYSRCVQVRQDSPLGMWKTGFTSTFCPAFRVLCLGIGLSTHSLTAVCSHGRAHPRCGGVLHHVRTSHDGTVLPVLREISLRYTVRTRPLTSLARSQFAIRIRALRTNSRVSPFLRTTTRTRLTRTFTSRSPNTTMENCWLLSAHFLPCPKPLISTLAGTSLPSRVSTLTVPSASRTGSTLVTFRKSGSFAPALKRAMFPGRTW